MCFSGQCVLNEKNERIITQKPKVSYSLLFDQSTSSTNWLPLWYAAPPPKLSIYSLTQIDHLLDKIVCNQH